MHINYCEQGQTLAEVCRKAKALGFDGVEFRRRRFEIEESQADYLDNLERSLAKYPLPFVSFGAPGPDLMLEDKGEREREIEGCAAFYAEARRRFGTSLFNCSTGTLRQRNQDLWKNPNLNGSGCAEDTHWHWAVEGLQKLGDIANSDGYKLSLEVHPHYLHDTLQSTVKLVNRVARSSVGILWDHVNLLALQNPPSITDALQLMGNHFTYIHLKNAFQANDASIPCALASGVVNHRELCRRTIAFGYDGPWCIEAPRSGDRECFAEQDLSYLRAVLRTIREEKSASPEAL